MRWGILAIVVVSGCQCGKTGLDPIDTTLAVDETLEFPDTFLGFPSTRSFTIQNRSRGAVHLGLSVGGGPFTLMISEVEVPGGASPTVAVTFSPDAVGPVTGEVTLESGSYVKRVALRGTGLTPPVCQATNPCRRSSFDPDAGACAESDVPDGTTCAGNSCNLDTRCVGGVCVGRAPDCSDGDLCTVDVCDVVGGCLHRPRTCPAPSNPCQVPTCDADAGCGSIDAPDGTRCGETDCITAQVCLQGTCRVVPAPDGLECSPGSLCRAPGTCAGQLCVLPRVTELPRQWTWRPDTGELDYDLGLQMDALGNVYTRECDPDCRTTGPQTVWLVSFTPQGVLRYRVQVPAAGVGRYPYDRRTQLVADGLVITTAGTLDITALDAATGQLRWAVDLGQTVTAPIKNSAVLGMTSPAPGRLVAAVTIDQVGSGFWGDWLVELSTVNGAMLWSRRRASYSELIADDQGTVYIGEYVLPLGAGRTVAIDSHGNDLFTFPGSPDEASAIYRGRVANGWGFHDLDAGIRSWESQGIPGLGTSGGGITFGAALLDPDSMYGARQLQAGGAFSSVVFSVDRNLVASRSWTWVAPGLRWQSTSALLATGELAEVAQGVTGYSLVAVRRGVVTMDCPLGFSNVLDAVLDQGTLVVMDTGRLAGYRVPGM